MAPRARARHPAAPQADQTDGAAAGFFDTTNCLSSEGSQPATVAIDRQVAQEDHCDDEAAQRKFGSTLSAVVIISLQV